MGKKCLRYHENPDGIGFLFKFDPFLTNIEVLSPSWGSQALPKGRNRGQSFSNIAVRKPSVPAGFPQSSVASTARLGVSAARCRPQSVVYI